MAKAKWLEESSNSQLLAIIRKSFEEEASKAAINKAEKAAIELEERTPEGDPSIPEVLDALRKNIDALAKAYDQEVEALVEEDEEEVEVDEEEVELPEADEEEELLEYEEMTLKDLRAEARARKVTVPAKAKKEELIAALEAADDADLESDEEEDVEDVEDVEEVIETEYDGMTLKALKTEARTRGIRVTNKMKKEDLIEILQDDDEA